MSCIRVSINSINKVLSAKLNYSTGVLISIGAVIDEAQIDSYITKKPCARARAMLVIQWIVIGFFFTMSYKSVLLTNLINIEYEQALDSIDDVVKSGKPGWQFSI